MPLSPSPAQSEASRHNGALSSGPATPAGKARQAEGATRHGLRAGPFRLLPGEDQALFAAHLDALLARYMPVDAAERHWVEQIAACAWRQRRLLDLESRAIAALDRPEPAADMASLPSLATLARYGGRIERDLRLAQAQLEALRRARPRLPAPLASAGAERLRWLAARLDAHVHAEPEPAPPSVPAAAKDPGPPAAGVDPGPAPNRHERRRRRALARLAAAP